MGERTVISRVPDRQLFYTPFVVCIVPDKERNDITITEDTRYNDNVCYQRFCCKIELAVIKKVDRYPCKASVIF